MKREAKNKTARNQKQDAWMETSEKQTKTGFEGTAFLLVMSALFIVIGAILLFVPQIEPILLCYCLSAGFIIFGIILIVRYFVTESYKKMHEYGFSIGVLLVILGSCALARAEELTLNLTIYFGICILITSVILLQNAIQMKNLNSTLWPVMLGFSCATIFCATLILANLSFMATFVDVFTYAILLLDGIASILSMIIASAELKNFRKKEYIKDTLMDIENPELKEAAAESEPVADMEASTYEETKNTNI